jgi:hypothetical protein
MLLKTEKYPYKIIKHNPRIGASLTVNVVRGMSRAARLVERYDEKLSVEDRDAGWSHYPARTTEQPWSTPKKPSPHYGPRHRPRDRGRR